MTDTVNSPSGAGNEVKTFPTTQAALADRRRAIACRPIDDLTPHAKNARTHDDAHSADIVASIERIG